MRLIFGLCIAVAGTTSFAADPVFTKPQIEYFEREIRPLLAKHCYACHSHKAKKLRGKLYLDSRAGVLKGGETGPAIVAGKSDKSLMVEALRHESFMMPPKTKLPKQTVAKFVKWIDMGAPWPREAAPGVAKTEKFDWKKRKASHWSWKPVKVFQPPPVRRGKWIRNPIDRYILSSLERKRLTPAKPAEKRVLIRRVYFDLIGLPPSPAEVDAFLKDNSIDAYEKVVDRLLKSKHFGEKWARHWLDLVRYGESLGHEFDYPIRHAFRYRDYLIRAFNRDVPYNQLVTEHIAGDLLSKPRRNPDDQTNESLVATGFWYFGEATHAPTDVRGDEALRIDNMIDVFSKTFLGLTVSCARCHDHKFDPIPTTDYYALSGFLQGTRKHDGLLDPGKKIRTAISKVEDARRKATQLAKPTLGERSVSAYLIAAREAWTIDPLNKATHGGFGKTARKDIVFEDFERSDYSGWKIIGSAFGKSPAKGTLPRQQHVFGFKGKQLVNTFHGGDKSMGVATSKAFKIERDYINLRVGGGHHKRKTCVDLLIDGAIVKTAVGRGPDDNEQLSFRSWDVRKHQGKEARIRIVDRHRGGWGHINVDDIVFSDFPATSMTNQKGMPDTRVIAFVAKKHQLDEKQLGKWLKALADPAAMQPTHAFYPWAKLVKVKQENFKQSWTAIARDLKTRDERAVHSYKETKLLSDFSDGGKGWFADGWAFPKSATNRHSIKFRRGGIGAVFPNTFDSGINGPNLHGSLRTPTFLYDHRDIYLRLRTNGPVTIRLIIDGYQMEPFNGLLFGGTRLRGNQADTKGQWKWIRIGNAMYSGHKAYVEINDNGNGEAVLDAIRFSKGVTPQDRPAEIARTLLTRPADLKTLADGYAAYAKRIATNWSGKLSTEQTAFFDFLLKHKLVDLGKNVVPIVSEASRIQQATPSPQYVLAVSDGTGEDERVFIRGNHKNLGQPVSRRMLIAIAGEKQPQLGSAGSGRLELAKRVTGPANPFVSRVMVNRLWHHLFGRGIVPTVDDFGKMGLPPSHPALLDWLAGDFVKNGWSIKKAIRQMVLSNTYRMSSRASRETQSRAEKIDPANSLLWRMRVRRLTAEQLRDAILAVSGRLDRKVGGDSVPVFLTPYMQGRGRPRSGPLDGAGRRSLYLATRRNFLSPMMLAFDFPVPFSSMGRRTVSNVPAQALMLMNDPFVKQQSEVWAQTIAGTTDQRIQKMFSQAFSQPPNAVQMRAARAFVAEQTKSYGSTNDARVWSDFAHMLFNMKGFLFLR